MALSLRCAKSPSIFLKNYRSFASAAADIVSVEFDQVDGKSTGVAIVRFNNPSTLNALTVDMGTTFESKIAELRRLDSKQLRCVILTGAGIL